MARYARMIRLWISAAMAAMTRTQTKPADGLPVLFMLDEMAQLGRMEPLITAVSLLAGYGMTMWMVWQDLAQLKSIYENEWPSFLANAKVQQFFGVNDHETAKMVSEMLGEETVLNESSSENVGRSSQGLFSSTPATKTTGTSVSISESARHLLKPDEVRRLSREAMLMFVQGCSPILAQRLAYFQDSEFGDAGYKRYDPNPYF
jgi:type IV secretion system protein VirD4